MPWRWSWVIAMSGAGEWRDDLDRWLQPFLAVLSHPARRAMCPPYLAGLIGLGDRKSVHPMAARADGVPYDRLHHFIAAGIWDEAPLQQALVGEADRLVGGSDAILVVDDTALPKKGNRSVGVAPQYATTLGKTGQLPDAGVAHAGARRGARGGRLGAVPARDLDGRPGPDGQGGCTRGPARGPDQAGDRRRGDRSGCEG